MSGDDHILDGALAALSGTATSDADDDARWAKRVASRITTAAPMSRRELDPILTAPFPDGFKDEDFDHDVVAADDHADHAAVAADVGGHHGWEGLMSEDSRPPGSLSGLAGLTRSGPTSASELGHAKADDSGLIDLRAMSETPPPVEEGAPPVSASELTKTLPAAPAALSASKLPIAGVASTASANAAVPPSSTTATAASAAAAAPATQKKKGAGMWIALGGLAAAAAIGLLVIPTMSKKDEAPTSASKTESAADKADKGKADEKVAAVEKTPPPATAPASAPEPAASAAVPDPAATVAAAPTGKMVAGGGPVAKGAPTVEPTKPGAKPTASAPTADPINKPAGGSLDDVLGIGKDQPATKKADPTEGLPDKPDSLDVRSAINSKVSAASGCVKGLDAPSSVSVAFGPTGSVSGVAVTSGPAKGTGAEACIKNAFSSAKVPASKKGATGNATLVP